MNTSLKKLLLVVFTLFLGIMSSGVRAQTYNATVNGTNYDFTYVTGTFDANSVLLQSQPWWGSQSTAVTFTSSVGSNLGLPNTAAGQSGPYFAFKLVSSLAHSFSSDAYSSYYGSY